MNGEPEKTLVRDKAYGTNSREIYLSCAALFGWDGARAGCFRKAGPLYAPNATPEHFGVLFIAHSNWGERMSDVKEYELSHDGAFFDELWYDRDAAVASEFEPRVVFVKKEDGNYYFLGVFEPSLDIRKTAWVYETRWVETYRCVSECYPPRAEGK